MDGHYYAEFPAEYKKLRIFLEPYSGLWAIRDEDTGRVVARESDARTAGWRAAKLLGKPVLVYGDGLPPLGY